MALTLNNTVLFRQRSFPVAHRLLRQSSAPQLNYSSPSNRQISAAFAPNTQAQVLSPAAPITDSEGWQDFASNVSGEWDGFGADFTPQGNPIELPEQVVPEAYREWEVQVFDWQTQCPTLAQTDILSLSYQTIKLLPTVGCEADAATRYSIDEKNIRADPVQDNTNNVTAFAYQSSGCYVAIWPGKEQVMEIEHCLISRNDKESRVRIIQVVKVEDGTLMELKGIKVYVEQWYGPFRNGDQLGGCSIRDSAFASTQALDVSRVAGTWQGVEAFATFHDSQDVIRECRDERKRKRVREGTNLVLLPKQLWSSLETNENDETCCEVGWLLEEGRAVTSRCVFSANAELKEIAIASENASKLE